VPILRATCVSTSLRSRFGSDNFVLSEVEG